MPYLHWYSVTQQTSIQTSFTTEHEAMLCAYKQDCFEATVTAYSISSIESSVQCTCLNAHPFNKMVKNSIADGTASRTTSCSCTAANDPVPLLPLFCTPCTALTRLQSMLTHDLVHASEALNCFSSYVNTDQTISSTIHFATH
jgi:hypothetical protein